MIMNGNAPTFISGVPNSAPSFATIRSQASAMPSEPARTWPFAAHRLVVARGLERADQLAQELGGEGVAGIRLVEGDRRDALVGDLVADRLVGQAASGLEVGSATPHFDG